MQSIDPSVSNKVLTVSASYKPVEGGIGQVISSYSKIYPVFYHVATMKGRSKAAKLFRLALAIFEFAYYCSFRNIRIVHIHGASNTSFRRKRIFIYLGRFFGKRIIYHVHGGGFQDFYGRNKAAVQKTLSKCDLLITLSSCSKDFFHSQVGHPNVHVVKNIVEPPKVVSGEGDGYVRFLFLGAIKAEKGIYDLIETIANNKNRLVDKAKFAIGGLGEARALEKQIRFFGLNELVTYEGWVSGDRKQLLLSRSDVFILPSYIEGLPISILEAMSYKLAIISTLIGGIPEIVAPGRNGFLLAPGDNEGLGDAIIKLVDDKEFRLQAGRRSFADVQAHFPRHVVSKLDRIYRDLLSTST